MLNRMILIACILTVTLTTDADACRHRRRRAASCPPPAAYACQVAPTIPNAPAYYVTPPMPTPQGYAPQAAVQSQAAPVAAVPSATTGGDAYSFTAWINNVRAQHGLPAVGWDANLAAWAEQNSAAGFGHTVVVCAQNAAVAATMEQACDQWMRSGPHRSLILNPSLTRVGLACVGSVWTLNGD